MFKTLCGARCGEVKSTTPATKNPTPKDDSQIETNRLVALHAPTKVPAITLNNLISIIKGHGRPSTKTNDVKPKQHTMAIFKHRFDS